jgi:hypothetical protein
MADKMLMKQTYRSQRCFCDPIFNPGLAIEQFKRKRAWYCGVNVGFVDIDNVFYNNKYPETGTAVSYYYRYTRVNVS